MCGQWWLVRLLTDSRVEPDWPTLQSQPSGPSLSAPPLIWPLGTFFSCLGGFHPPSSQLFLVFTRVLAQRPDRTKVNIRAERERLSPPPTSPFMFNIPGGTLQLAWRDLWKYTTPTPSWCSSSLFIWHLHLYNIQYMQHRNIVTYTLCIIFCPGRAHKCLDISLGRQFYLKIFHSL